jgi:hypothetical protein
MSDAIDPEWATWFLGFMEGDGSFYIKSCGGVDCKIELRNDDWRVLANIRNRTGIGSLAVSSRQYMRNKGVKAEDVIRWRVSGPDCLRIVEVLEAADVEAYFGSWLAGFMDAEGYFRITNKGSVQCKISLRNDDWRVLANIRDKTGVGSLTVNSKQYMRNRGGKNKDQISWAVNGSDCLEVVNLLEGKMQTKKAVDVGIWADAVRFAAGQKRGAPGKKEKMLEYKAMLEDARRYVAPSEEELQAALGRFKEGGLNY